MHIVDTTMFFARESGGVKRYLLAKRAWLARHKGIRHSLLVPGVHDQDDGDGVHTLASPPLPFSHGYHFPVRMGQWRERLHALAPDLIEVGDPYQPAWAALRVGREYNVPVIGWRRGWAATWQTSISVSTWCWPPAGPWSKVSRPMASIGSRCNRWGWIRNCSIHATAMPICACVWG